MKEQSDDREREIKFSFTGELEDLIDQLRRFSSPAWPLVTFPPRAIMDLYFDTPAMDLLTTGATLRLRKRRINLGWTVNYKSPRKLDENDFVDRREVITRVRIDEALGFREQHIPGLAWRCALEFCAENSFEPMLRPRAYLTTWRTGWTIRTGDIDDRQNNYLCLFHDDVTAFDISGQNPEWIIRAGALDYSASTPPNRRFSGYEIESSGRSLDDEDGAIGAMRSIAHALAEDERFTNVTKNKYQWALLANAAE
jgi:CYTH domain